MSVAFSFYALVGNHEGDYTLPARPLGLAGFSLEEIMTAFKSHRTAHEYIQTNPAPPQRVFPLLCPVREGDWLPGWQYRLMMGDN
jgi:hypothetical protein